MIVILLNISVVVCVRAPLTARGLNISCFTVLDAMLKWVLVDDSEAFEPSKQFLNGTSLVVERTQKMLPVRKT